MSATLTSFTTVDFPGAQPTSLYKINNAGDAVGGYSISGVGHGFLRSGGGTLSTIDPPGSSNTTARGINSLNQPVIVGPYASSTGQHSFILAGGNYTSFDPTGASAINDLGQIVGTYLDASGVWHGFLRDVNGTITPIDVPGAAGTKAIGINNGGQIVGSYGNFITFSHGFIRDTAGNFTTFDVPGATFTDIFAINNVGEIVGEFSGVAGGHGFFRDAAGTLSTIDVPISGAKIAGLIGLNGSRGVAGTYTDPVGGHGFVGTLTPNVFWGVDSFTPANQKIKALVGSQVVTAFLYDIVTLKGGKAPAFWGRYIGKNGNLIPDEIGFLHDPTRNCKILLIFRDTISSTLQTLKQGVDHANTAIKSARDLGAPGGVWVYADTEFPTQSPTAEWFQGWFKTMQDPTISSYGAGVYGNTSTGAAPQFDTPFCTAYPIFAQPTKAYVYANQRNFACNISAAQAPSFSNAIIPQPCNPPTVVYQYSINCDVSQALDPNGMVDLDLANAAGLGSTW